MLNGFSNLQQLYESISYTRVVGSYLKFYPILKVHSVVSDLVLHCLLISQKWTVGLLGLISVK